MSNTTIRLENVSKFYKLYNSPKDRLKEALHPFGKKRHKEFYALKNINLEIKKGEILGIVGRNGSGKSTLLKLISGVIQPNSGKITVNGNISALLELGSGLNPEFTGMQNIYFSGTMMGFSRKEMEEKADDIVSFADIGNYIHQPLKTYSSGMKARLGFALAINMTPKILILDEVLAVGDELFRRKCYAKMEEFFKSGCTVFYVSHSVEPVNEICTKAILLDKGELILEGPPKLVTMHYQKFLYSKSNDINKTRDEIIRLNRDEDKKNEFVKKIENNEKKKEDKKSNKTEVEKDESKLKAFYIPNLKPKSTIEYKNYDVEIYDMHIKTLGGNKVNVLAFNEKYIHTYKLKFNIDSENVAFGFTFKTEKGVVVTGVHNTKENRLKHVHKGQALSISTVFKCNLLPGIYYIDCGVKGDINNERVFLNRIVDCFAFKIQREDEIPYWGLVTIDQEMHFNYIS